MRSAADIDDVGCPDPAAELARIESIRSCRPRLAQVSFMWSFIVSSLLVVAPSRGPAVLVR